MIFRFKKVPFPFGKIVNSVSKGFLNMEILFGHRHCTHQIPFTKEIYELRIRVLSKSHMISKPLRHRLQDSSAGLISHVLCRECLAWIARCDDWTKNWSTYITIARVRLQQKYFCTHFLCAPQDWCKRSPLHCWNDIQCSDDIAIHAQAMVTLHVRGSYM